MCTLVLKCSLMQGGYKRNISFTALWNERRPLPRGRSTRPFAFAVNGNFGCFAGDCQQDGDPAVGAEPRCAAVFIFTSLGWNPRFQF